MLIPKEYWYNRPYVVKSCVIDGSKFSRDAGPNAFSLDPSTTHSEQFAFCGITFQNFEVRCRTVLTSWTKLAFGVSCCTQSLIPFFANNANNDRLEYFHFLKQPPRFPQRWTLQPVSSNESTSPW